ncbi:MAG TPA: hypothetical protein VN540_10020 [Clostridia bacterium]|nr:hypothetical protein [Clostridia bacterium]
MERNVVPMEQKRIEHVLTKICLQIETAADLSRKAKELASSAESLLMAAQREAEDLYISLDQKQG